jgi:hypothetical protein
VLAGESGGRAGPQFAAGRHNCLWGG